MKSVEYRKSGEDITMTVKEDCGVIDKEGRIHYLEAQLVEKENQVFELQEEMTAMQDEIDTLNEF